MFAFTDDLDVTHRLFHNLRDAEGFDRFGKPDPKRAPLATMRGRKPYPGPRREPQNLPTKNQYILRMQVAFALLD